LPVSACQGSSKKAIIKELLSFRADKKRREWKSLRIATSSTSKTPILAAGEKASFRR
jgi:hypothetical protein